MDIRGREGLMRFHFPSLAVSHVFVLHASGVTSQSITQSPFGLGTGIAQSG